MAENNRADKLPKSWDPATVESALYQEWVDRGYFTADVNSPQPALTNRTVFLSCFDRAAALRQSSVKEPANEGFASGSMHSAAPVTVRVLPVAGEPSLIPA